MSSSYRMSLLLSARDWAAILDPPATSPGSAAISNLADNPSWVSLSHGGFGARVGSSQEQLGAVTYGKSFVVLHTETSYCAL